MEAPWRCHPEPSDPLATPASIRTTLNASGQLEFHQDLHWNWIFDSSKLKNGKVSALTLLECLPPLECRETKKEKEENIKKKIRAVNAHEKDMFGFRDALERVTLIF